MQNNFLIFGGISSQEKGKGKKCFGRGGGGGAVDRGFYGGERVANAIDFLSLSRQYKE